MNTIKFRPVGKTGPITRVRVSQSKRSIYGLGCPRRASVAMANKAMDRKGFVRAGVRHG